MTEGNKPIAHAGPKNMQTRTKSRTIKKTSSVDKNKKVQQKIKFNLSPEHQYVRASFRDTTKAVEKLRKEAEEKRKELRD